MTATVRLDEKLSETLNQLATDLHKKKSEIIREAILLYAKRREEERKQRLLSAVSKTREVDRKESLSMEGTLSDGLEG